MAGITIAFSLPVEPEDEKSAMLEVSQFNAQLLLPPHQLYLSHAEAEIYGIKISATGRLNNPELYRPGDSRTPNEKQNRSKAVRRFIAELQRLRFAGGAPRLELRFSGDLAEPEKILVEGGFSAPALIRGNYRLQNLGVTWLVRNSLCEVSRCVASDAYGTLNASGHYEIKTGQLSFELRSTLDLPAIGHAFKLNASLDELVFYAPPTLDLTAEIGGGDLKLLGHLAVQKFSVRSVPFQSLEADFAIEKDRWFIDGLHLSHRSGEINGSAMQLPGDFRARLQSTIDPRALLPLTSGKMAEVLGEWEFIQPPLFYLEAHGPSMDPNVCEVNGDMALRKTRLRGVGINAATARLKIKDKAVTYENFKLDRDEGSATGTFTYDFGKHEVRMDQIHTTLNTTEAAVWIDPGFIKDVAPYRFKNRPSLTLNGVVQFAGGKDTHLDVLVDGAEGMDYTFLKRNLPVQKISAHLLFTDQRLRISDLTANLFAGNLRGNADISFSKKSPGYKAEIEADRIDFPSLTKLYFNYDTAHGLLTGNYAFEGKGSDARTMRGTGNVAVTNGNVFAIPLLGPFSEILNGIVPGMGYNVAKKASSTFAVQDGVIETSDFNVEGRGFSMFGNGKLFFLDDKIDFSIRINAQGLPGIFLFPVSKLLEYVSDESLTKPVWRPKRLPRL
jgi:hypothetical protein